MHEVIQIPVRALLPEECELCLEVADYGVQVVEQAADAKSLFVLAIGYFLQRYGERGDGFLPDSSGCRHVSQCNEQGVQRQFQLGRRCAREKCAARRIVGRSVRVALGLRVHFRVGEAGFGHLQYVGFIEVVVLFGQQRDLRIPKILIRFIREKNCLVDAVEMLVDNFAQPLLGFRPNIDDDAAEFREEFHTLGDVLLQLRRWRLERVFVEAGNGLALAQELPESVHRFRR